MQILVEVAITQMKLLRVEVRKGFERIVFIFELVGPKCLCNLFIKWNLIDEQLSILVIPIARKGKRLIFLYLTLF